jgi:hypothetical protein
MLATQIHLMPIYKHSSIRLHGFICFFFFYGASSRFRAIASPTFFLHSSLSLAAAFQFRTQSSLAIPLCMTSSHLFHGLPSSLPPPTHLSSTFFGIRHCSILTTWLVHINLPKLMYVQHTYIHFYL